MTTKPTAPKKARAAAPHEDAAFFDLYRQWQKAEREWRAAMDAYHATLDAIRAKLPPRPEIMIALGVSDGELRDLLEREQQSIKRHIETVGIENMPKDHLDALKAVEKFLPAARKRADARWISRNDHPDAKRASAKLDAADKRTRDLFNRLVVTRTNTAEAIALKIKCATADLTTTDLEARGWRDLRSEIDEARWACSAVRDIRRIAGRGGQ